MSPRRRVKNGQASRGPDAESREPRLGSDQTVREQLNLENLASLPVRDLMRLVSIAVQQNKWQYSDQLTYDIDALNDDKARFIEYLDAAKLLLDVRSELRDVFESHALTNNYVFVPPSTAFVPGDDSVAVEIAEEVTIKWAHRNLPVHQERSRKWWKRPDQFIVDVYKKWHSSGRLQLRHLQHDKALYRAYLEAISRHPEYDLQLEARSLHRPKSKDQKVLFYPRPGVPVSELTDAERGMRRAYNRQMGRSGRSAKP